MLYFKYIDKTSIAIFQVILLIFYNVIFRQSQNVNDILQGDNGVFQEIDKYLEEWHCHDSSILKCYRTLISRLVQQELIAEESRQIAGKILIKCLATYKIYDIYYEIITADIPYYPLLLDMLTTSYTLQINGLRI